MVRNGQNLRSVGQALEVSETLIHRWKRASALCSMCGLGEQDHAQFCGGCGLDLQAIRQVLGGNAPQPWLRRHLDRYVRNRRKDRRGRQNVSDQRDISAF